MTKTRRSYSREFKVEAVKLVTEKGQSIAEAARSLGIHENQLRTWKQALAEESQGQQQAFPGHGNRPALEDELHRLKAENRRLQMERDLLKKSDGVVRQGGDVIFSFIEEHKSRWPVTLMCQVFTVSPSGFYAWLSRPQCEQQRRREAILAEIQAVHAEVKQRYGSPRIHAELQDRGVPCSVNTVAKLMHDNAIRAKTARKFRNTTDSKHSRPVADNLLDREFNPSKPNEAWLADITYIWTREGWLYLAAVEDLYSRMVVGWSMADHMESRLVVDALEMAVARRLPEEGLLAHSDRGSQYASEHYQTLLLKHGIDCSMSGKGQCWDNAPMESFFCSLKKELVYDEDYHTRAEARGSIFEYIEVFYNLIRRHSALGFLSPVEFEKSERDRVNGCAKSGSLT